MWYASGMNDKESGNVPQTIDSKGNITPKPYGISRWASPRVYDCEHTEDCSNPAQFLHRKVANIGKSHNCCGSHEHERVSVDEIFHK